MEDDSPPYPIIIGIDESGGDLQETGILRKSNVRKRLYRVASSRRWPFIPDVRGRRAQRAMRNKPEVLRWKKTPPIAISPSQYSGFL